MSYIFLKPASLNHLNAGGTSSSVSPRQGFDTLLSNQILPQPLRNGSPPQNHQSPLYVQSMTPAQKKFLDEYYQKQTDKQNALRTISAVQAGNNSTSNSQKASNNGSFVQQQTQQSSSANALLNQKFLYMQQRNQRVSNSNQTQVQIYNLSMKNVNQTLNINKEQQQQLIAKSFRENAAEKSNSNQGQNNVRNTQFNHQAQPSSQQPLVIANKLKILSKSPPQQNEYWAGSAEIQELKDAIIQNRRKRSRQMQDHTLHKESSQSDSQFSSQQPTTASSSTAIFNPNTVKLKLKSGSSETIEKEIILIKAWLREHIPHIAKVISDVKDDEGVEITINCNVESFEWIISYLKSKSEEEQIELCQQINEANCLNLIVSTCFLGLDDLYHKIWRLYFHENFLSIINNCQLNLNNMSKKILQDIASKVDDETIEQLTDRRDKFISVAYQAKVDYLVQNYKIQACLRCDQVLDKTNMQKISCVKQTDDSELDQYITFDGKVIIRHRIDKTININKFVTNFREKYRVCWKEIYERLQSVTQPALYCLNCDEWFPLNQIGHCRYHNSQPVRSTDANEQVFICCMNNEIAYAGCNSKANNGCVYDFHQPQLDSEEKKYQYNRFQEKWLMIKDRLDKEKSEKIILKYTDQIQFLKPQSFNFEMSLSQAYSEAKNQSQQQQFTKSKVANDDTLFHIPKAQKHLAELKSDKFRDQISRQVKLQVRSKSPDQQSQIGGNSTRNLHGNQIRVTLDVDTNKVSVKKRSLSPQQIKEVQQITRKKIWENKQDIIRDDDFSSMKILNQLLTQQRVAEEETANQQAISVITSRQKNKKHTYYIDISQISEPRFNLKNKEVLNSKRSNNSQERRKKSPVLMIKQNMIQRKASPN